MAFRWIGALVEPPIAELIDDGVLERLARHDLRGLQVLPHHLDDALAGEIGDLPALLVRRGNCGAAGQHHAERLGERVHRRRRAHRVAEAGRRRRGGDQLEIFRPVDLAGGLHLLREPLDRAGAGALALVPAVQHRPDGKRDRRDVDGRRRHQLRRAWSCRSRWSAPRRRADSRTASRPGRDRRGCGRARRSAACRSPGSDAPGTRRRCRPPRGCPRARAAPGSMWWRLQGERSEPDCAMPISGLPDCSSSRVSPQFM